MSDPPFAQSRRRVAVVTDGTADLPEPLRREAGVTVVPVEVRIDGRMLAGHEDLRTALTATAGHAETVAPSPEHFAEIFRRLGRDHDAVVAVVVSGRLGRVCETARAGAALVERDVPVTVVDSRSASMGIGFQTLRAAALADEGMDAEAIADVLRGEEWRYPVAFFVDTLEHLQRGGRIGRAAALIGEALQLKPLLRIDEGQVVPLDRTRTRARAIDGLVEFVRGLGAIERVCALYAGDPRDGERLAARLRDECGVPAERVFAARIGAAVEVHIGPGAMGVAVADVDG